MIAILFGIVGFYVAIIYLMAYLIGRFDKNDYGDGAYVVQSTFWPVYLVLQGFGAGIENLYLMGKKARKR